MYQVLVERALRAYGVKPAKVFAFQKGYRNEVWPALDDKGAMLNLTFFKREPGVENRIKRTDLISGFLADNGFPARKRLDDRLLQLKSGQIVINAGVYNYLPGNTIPWEAYTMEKIKTLGSVMSVMHQLLAKCTVELPSAYAEYAEIIQRMDDYFSRGEIQNAMAAKLKVAFSTSRLEDHRAILNELELRPGKQPLHMDFVRGNILFEGDKITGVLDFEKTAAGHPVMDIARTLAFLLVDCKYKQPDKVTKYFLYSGYVKRGRSKDIGDQATRNALVEMFLVYDFYKFLRHNPYESLDENEHYTRTRDMLIGLGVLLFR